MIYYENIVIGSCINALMYAFINRYPVFFTSPQKPFRFDYLDPAIDLTDFKLSNWPAKSLTTFGGKKDIGIPKELLWERLLFLISLEGLAPLANLCHGIRYDGSSVVCSNEYSKIMEFKFGNCSYFMDDNSKGFAEKTNLDEERYLCYDYIAFNSGGKHEIDYIHTGDDFVSEIWFYGSDRIDGNTPVRDACAVSNLSKQQLTDFDFSQTMTKFKTIQVMKDNGMRGKFNGYTKKGTPRHYDFRTTSIRRETRRREYEPKSSASNIKVEKTSEKDLLQLLHNAIKPYNRILGMLDENSP